MTPQNSEVMFPSSYQKVNNNETALIFRGIFFESAPLNIPLGFLVIVQNSVIFMSFYKDKAKFIPSLLMGIALADIVKAHGDIVLTIISILAHFGTVDIAVLYKSIFYFVEIRFNGLSLCVAITPIFLSSGSSESPTTGRRHELNVSFFL